MCLQGPCWLSKLNFWLSSSLYLLRWCHMSALPTVVISCGFWNLGMDGNGQDQVICNIFLLQQSRVTFSCHLWIKETMTGSDKISFWEWVEAYMYSLKKLLQFSTANHCDDLFVTRCLSLFKRTILSQSWILRSAVSLAGLEHLLDVCVIVVSVCVFKIVL